MEELKQTGVLHLELNDQQKDNFAQISQNEFNFQVSIATKLSETLDCNHRNTEIEKSSDQDCQNCILRVQRNILGESLQELIIFRFRKKAKNFLDIERKVFEWVVKS